MKRTQVALPINFNSNFDKWTKSSLDAVMDYDEAHGTFTMCLVWPKQKRALAGLR